MVIEAAFWTELDVRAGPSRDVYRVDRGTVFAAPVIEWLSRQKFVQRFRVEPGAKESCIQAVPTATVYRHHYELSQGTPKTVPPAVSPPTSLSEHEQ